MAKTNKREKWSGLLAEQLASGLTKKAFCAERGIKLATFYYWQGLLRGKQEAGSVGFQRLNPVEEHELTVCLPRRDLVLRSKSVDTLAQVIKALADA